MIHIPLGEIEGIGTSYPGRVLDYATEIGILTEEERIIFGIKMS